MVETPESSRFGDEGRVGAKKFAVDRSYDLFEIFPDRSAIWKGAVVGQEEAIRELKELAAETTNEMPLMHVPTNMVIAAMNAPKL
jgi:hypothetical protein